MENNYLKNMINTDVSEFDSFLLFHEEPETFKELLKFCNRSSLIALSKILTKNLKDKHQLKDSSDYLAIILNLFKKEPIDEVMADLGNVLTLLLMQDPIANKHSVLALNQVFEQNLELINSKFLKMVAAMITAYVPDNMEVLTDLQDKLINGLLSEVFPEEYMYCIAILLTAPSAEAKLLKEIAERGSTNLHVWCCFFDKMNKHMLVKVVELLKPIQESLRFEGAPRKQSLFLIKKLMNSNLLSTTKHKIFKKLVIIIENLEEKQFHLIQPALELIHEIKFDDSALKQILLELILKHDNSQVVHWGIKFCLTNKVFDGIAAQNQSLMQIFLNAINKTGLYGKSQHSDQLVDLKSLNKFAGQNIELLFTNIHYVNWLSVPFYFILLEVKNHNISKISNTIETLENLAVAAKKVQNLQIRYGVQNTLSDILQSIAGSFQVKQMWKVIELIFQVSENVTVNNKIVSCLKNVTAEDVDCFLQLNNSSQFRELVFTELLIQKKISQEKIIIGIGIIPAVRAARLASVKDSRLNQFYLDEVYRLLSTTVNHIMFKFLEYDKDETLHNMFEELKLNQKLDAPANEIEAYESLKFSFLNVENCIHSSINIPLLTLLYNHPAIQNDSALNNAIISHLNLTNIEDLNLINTNCHIEILHTSQVLGQVVDQDKVLSSVISLIEKASESHLCLLMDSLVITTKNIDGFNSPRTLIIETFIDRLFEEVFAIKNYHTFFEYYKSLLELLFAPSKRSDWSVKLVLKYHKFIIAQTGPYNTKIVALFYEKFFYTIQYCWNDDNLEYNDILKIGLLYGENQSRDQRIQASVCKTIADEDEFFKKRFIVADDKMVRIKCALFINSNRIHTQVQTISIMNEIMQDFEKLSKQKPRYFPNSLMHCLKQRYLAPLVFCENISEATKTIIMNEILYQNNQPNICYLLEIILANSLVKRESANEIVDILASDNALKAPNLQSLFAVLFIFCRAMKNRMFAEKAIEVILPYTMGQNFGTRLYSQITVLQLIQEFDIKSLHIVEESIRKSFQCGNAAKHFKRILEDFRYTSLNYDRLLSIDMAYHHLPRIGGIFEEEIITYELYAQACQELSEFDPLFYEMNVIDRKKFLIDCLMPKDCSMEKVHILTETKIENLVVSEDLLINNSIKCESVTNVQQKIIPYKFQLPSQTLLATVTRAVNLESKSKLIVVASLVSRAPNLGGLARSCEIFGVQNYIIDSLKQMESNDFKSLSKSAEKWLKISEIKSWQLFDYLLHMKTQQGYCILGAEQTASSQNVIAAKLPKKSILLLGHEKEGIPANLLSLLDITLEIPQAGVLRSLNVHVSGAIIIFEYAKQHIF